MTVSDHTGYSTLVYQEPAQLADSTFALSYLDCLSLAKKELDGGLVIIRGPLWFRPFSRARDPAVLTKSFQLEKIGSFIGTGLTVNRDRYEPRYVKLRFHLLL
jgi:hypothetical protein